jgi:hypothetical protein
MDLSGLLSATNEHLEGSSSDSSGPSEMALGGADMFGERD